LKYVESVTKDFTSRHDRFSAEEALPHSLVSVPDMVLAVSAFHAVAYAFNVFAFCDGETFK